MNSGINVLGQGNRANATIGRALQLVVRNVGGGRPGERRSRHARQPRQVHVLLRRGRRGLALGAAGGRARRRARRLRGDAVRAATGRASWSISSRASRTRWRAPSRARSGRVHAPEARALLRRGPDHLARARARVRARRAGPSSACARRSSACRRPGPRWRAARADAPRACPSTSPRWRAFRSFGPAVCYIVHAGGKAGLFSAIIGGWAGGAVGSVPITKEVEA